MLSPIVLRLRFVSDHASGFPAVALSNTALRVVRQSY
jgi:hypothetical protein